MATWIKRFLVFAGAVDSPNGGWDDCCGSFNDVPAAREAVRARWLRDDKGRVHRPPCVKWYQIIDTHEDGRVENGVSGENNGIQSIERSGRPFE